MERSCKGLTLPASLSSPPPLRTYTGERHWQGFPFSWKDTHVLLKARQALRTLYDPGSFCGSGSRPLEWTRRGGWHPAFPATPVPGGGQEPHCHELLVPQGEATARVRKCPSTLARTRRPPKSGRLGQAPQGQVSMRVGGHQVRRSQQSCGHGVHYMLANGTVCKVHNFWHLKPLGIVSWGNGTP